MTAPEIKANSRGKSDRGFPEPSGQRTDSIWSPYEDSAFSKRASGSLIRRSFIGAKSFDNEKLMTNLRAGFSIWN
jgi:hypothetical protein